MTAPAPGKTKDTLTVAPEPPADAEPQAAGAPAAAYVLPGSAYELPEHPGAAQVLAARASASAMVTAAAARVVPGGGYSPAALTLTPSLAAPVTPPRSAPHSARPVTPPAQAPRYTVGLARDADEVRAAQRLRHLVFAEEMGAQLHSPEPGIDTDEFDAHCDHLVVREETSDTVVGTYRLLPPGRADAAGGLYAAGEFALGNHVDLHSDLVEVGRSCVHPDHREGAVIGLMWAGIARYLDASGHNWLAGCCSVPLADGGLLAADVAEAVRRKYWAPEEYRVAPYRPWTVPDEVAARDADRTRQPLPPLLRGYLRLGAWVCGEPAYDADFGVADFYILLSLRRTDPRYLRRFLALESA